MTAIDDFERAFNSLLRQLDMAGWSANRTQIEAAFDAMLNLATDPELTRSCEALKTWVLQKINAADTATLSEHNEADFSIGLAIQAIGMHVGAIRTKSRPYEE